jgi:hypothetical protein
VIQVITDERRDGQDRAHRLGQAPPCRLQAVRHRLGQGLRGVLVPDKPVLGQTQPAGGLGDDHVDKPDRPPVYGLLSGAQDNQQLGLEQRPELAPRADAFGRKGELQGTFPEQAGHVGPFQQGQIRPASQLGSQQVEGRRIGKSQRRIGHQRTGHHLAAPSLDGRQGRQ